MASPSSTIIAPASSTDGWLTTLPELPKYSLAPQVLDWCKRYIRQPDGPDAGGPWTFTKEQRRFLFYLYAVDPTGRFLWNRAVLRRAKGWGKSPFMAAIALAELCGPVRCTGFYRGEPVAEAVKLPWVQLAAISEKQVTNTMSMVLAMIKESPIIDDYGLDPGLTRIYMASGGKLEPITASAPTAEGARPSFCVLDESHLWKQTDGGHKLAEVIRRNLGKSRDGSARSVETTNAHEMGMDSVAERSYQAWQSQISGDAKRITILYDSREAPPDIDLRDENGLRRGLDVAYGDSDWVDQDRLIDEIWDPSTPPSEARRFYFNQLVVAEDAWLSPQEWDRCADRTKLMLDGEEITLGFDGSKTEDWTALIACRVSDSHLFPLGIWNPATTGDQAPRAAINLAVRQAFAKYDVVGFLSDLEQWESYVDEWAEEYGNGLSLKASSRHQIAFDMRGNKLATVQMLASFHDAVLESNLTHDGAPVLSQHVYNARRRPHSYGIDIGKPDDAHKIDAAVAAALARKARQDYLALPASKKRRRRTGNAVFAG